MLRKQKQSLLILLGFMILSLIFILPIIIHPEILFASDDFSFHMPRTLSLYRTIQSGHLIPSFDYSAFGSYGSAYNLFYPYLLNSYPIAIFRLISGSWTAAYITYYWIITLSTLLIAYYAIQTITKTRMPALIFSIIYTFSTYRAIDSFFRADLGELLVITSLPLVFCGIELLIRGDYYKWPMLTVGMTLVAYSHVLSLLTISIFIILRLLFCITNLSKQLIISLVKATTMTLLLSSFQLFSIIEQYHFQPLRSVVIVNLLDKTASFATLLQSSLSNQYITPDVISPGLIVFLLAILILHYSYQLLYHFNYVSISALLGLMAIILSTTLFPWYLLNRLPFNIIQFPFRFLMLASYFIIFSGTLIFSELLNKLPTSTRKYSLIVLFILIMTLHLQTSTNLIQHSPQDSRLTYETIVPPNNYDYHPNVNLFKLQTIKQKLFKVNNKSYQNSLSLKHTNQSFYFDYHTSSSSTAIDTPVIRYKGVKAFDNGHTIPTIRSNRGTIEILLHDAGKHHITITYRMSSIRKLTLLISITSLIVLIGYNLLLQFKKSLWLKGRF